MDVDDFSDGYDQEEDNYYNDDDDDDDSDHGIRLENAFRTTQCEPCLTSMDDGSTVINQTFRLNTYSSSNALTPDRVVSGIPWKLCLETVLGRPHIYVLCFPQSRSKTWSCVASLEFKLVPFNADKTPHIHTVTDRSFHSLSNKVVFEGTTVLLPLENDSFVKDGTINVQLKINVSSVQGIRVPPPIDFRVPRPDITDAHFLIEGTKIYISKMLLATFSPVFRSMFYSDFKEKNTTEIPIEGVKVAEFIDFLSIMHPTDKVVTGSSVNYLLELADRFDVVYVTKACENFLMSNKHNIKVIPMFKLSEKYSLPLLQVYCIQKVRTDSNSEKLMSMEGYEDLSESTKLAILEGLAMRQQY